MQSSTATETKKAPFSRNHLIRDAIGQAIHEEMCNDASIHLFGEGAHMKIHFDHPVIERHFSDRVHTLPISEDGNTNFAVGASLVGVKPVVDVITSDFLYRTLDSIANTAAKLNFVAGPNGEQRTIVIRSEFLTAGPTNGQRPEALFAHIPGIRVAVPSTPRDAYGLMRTALTTPGVTVFFEDRMIQDEWTSEPDQRLSGSLVFGYAMERQNGSIAPELTIVTYGLMRQVVESTLKRWGIADTDSSWAMDIDLLDLRTIYPIDWMAIKASVRRSGKLLIVEPDVAYGGVGAEIVAHMAEDLPGIKVRRLGAPRQIVPASPALHSQMLPTGQEIIDAINSF